MDLGLTLYLTALGDALRGYFIACGAAYAVFHGLLRRRLARRKITQSPTGLRAPLQEIGRTIVSNLLGRAPLVLALAYLAREHVIPARLIYLRIDERGGLYFAATIAFDVLLFDLWFYLSHRYLLHSKLGYRHVHIVHHYSVDPTPFARNSVHPVESVMNGVFHVLPVFLVPHHPLAILLATQVKGLVGIMGHLGYEIFWPGFTRHWLTRYLCAPVHHHLHHARSVRTNFGFLINYDRIFGSLSPEYHEAFEATVGRREPAPALGATVGRREPAPVLAARAEAGAGAGASAGAPPGDPEELA